MSKTKQIRRDNLLLKDCKDNLVVNRVASRLYEDINTPISLSCYLLLKYNELEQLVNKEVSPLWYNDSFAFRDDYLATSYLRKFGDFNIPQIRRSEVAWQKFLDAEESCKQTNRRFKQLESGSFSDPEVESILFLAQSKISHILGPIRVSCLLDSGFGPGVTSSCVGDRTGLAEKFKSELNATRDSLKYVKPLLGLSPLWSKSLHNTEPFEPDYCDLPVKVVNYSKIAFVPKDAKTDRTIGIEPHLNIYLQKGIGSYVRKRLRNAGIDLTDQSRNQELARFGSKTASLATIDLSSASDTVSQGLVWNLLPYDWACLLDDTRSKYYQSPDGTISRYAKWSSMGNGYTFELESLLFFALADSVCKHLDLAPHGLKKIDNSYHFLSDLIGVYGDDIIVPVEAYDLLERVLSFCGFTLNKRKSFSNGYFRESCGKDWFKGVDVRPIFLKGKVDDIPSAFSCANALRLISHRRLNGLGCDNRIRRTYDTVIGFIPKPFRTRIPLGFGDVGLISNFDESCPKTIRKSLYGLEGFEFRALISKGLKYRCTNAASAVLQSLHGLPEQTNGYSVYRRRVIYVTKRVSATQWPDLGAWF